MDGMILNIPNKAFTNTFSDSGYDNDLMQSLEKETFQRPKHMCDIKHILITN